jgi:hypothetical protein
MYERILAAIDWTPSTRAMLHQTRHLASLTDASSRRRHPAPQQAGRPLGLPVGNDPA